MEKDRRGKKKAKIVTYDWLEDSFEAERAIQDVDVYHPGKPRDNDAIAKACRKRRKTTKRKSENELAAPEKESPTEVVEITQPKGAESKPLVPNLVEPRTKEKPQTIAVGKTSNSVVTKSSISAPQATSHKTILFGSQSNPVSPPKSETQQGPMLEKPKDKTTPANVSGTGVSGLSWEARHKPRVFCDKTDQFRYNIKLTHKKRPGERWVLMLLKAPKITEKAFLFRAYQYNAKDKIDLKENKSPPSIFQTAFELFKTSFRSKMGYPWDERLVRSGIGQLGNWRCTLPAKGEPTGQVPPEFDPGHPKYVKPKDLAPVALTTSGQRAIERSVSGTPYGRKPISPFDNHMYNRLIKNKVSKPLNTGAESHKGKLGGIYLSKARKSAAPISLKRRANEPLSPNPRPKMRKTGGENYKSSEFIRDSDTDDD